MRTVKERLFPIKELVKLTPEQEARFWSRVSKDGPLPDQANPHYVGLGQCHVWVKGRNRQGYGRFHLSRDAGAYNATRVVWYLRHGSMPADLLVCHRCDNPACVNPDHLFLGSYKDNAVDSKSKDRNCRGDRHWSRTTPEKRATGKRNGRHTMPHRTATGDRNGSVIHPESRLRGEQQKQSKLKEKDIPIIRRMYATGIFSQKRIGQFFNVSRSAIKHVLTGHRWKTF